MVIGVSKLDSKCLLYAGCYMWPCAYAEKQGRERALLAPLSSEGSLHEWCLSGPHSEMNISCPHCVLQALFRSLFLCCMTTGCLPCLISTNSPTALRALFMPSPLIQGINLCCFKKHGYLPTAAATITFFPKPRLHLLPSLLWTLLYLFLLCQFSSDFWGTQNDSIFT